MKEMTGDAEVVSVEFTKSVIKSRHAFSYAEAQVRIDDASFEDELTVGMRTLLDLSKKLKQRRMEAGALNLASPEVKVQTDSETSDPVDVQSKELLATNSLVEEFMLLANISVARRIYQHFNDTAMLRYSSLQLKLIKTPCSSPSLEFRNVTKHVTSPQRIITRRLLIKIPSRLPR